MSKLKIIGIIIGLLIVIITGCCDPCFSCANCTAELLLNHDIQLQNDLNAGGSTCIVVNSGLGWYQNREIDGNGYSILDCTNCISLKRSSASGRIDNWEIHNVSIETKYIGIDYEGYDSGNRVNGGYIHNVSVVSIDSLSVIGINVVYADDVNVSDNYIDFILSSGASSAIHSSYSDNLYLGCNYLFGGGDDGVEAKIVTTNQVINNNFAANFTTSDFDVAGVLSYANNTCDNASGITCECETSNITCYTYCRDLVFCDCYSCVSCTEKLNSNQCSEVVLMNSISSAGGVCIDGYTANNFKNKIFDCNDYTVVGNNDSFYSTLIYLTPNNFGNTLKNCILKDSFFSVQNYRSNNNFVENFTFMNNTKNIFVRDSNNFNLLNSIIVEGGFGFQCVNSNEIKISMSTIYNNSDVGASFQECSNINIFGSDVIYNRGGLYFRDSTADVKGNIICRNIEKDESYFDIYNSGGSIAGKNNYCDLSLNFFDGDISGCRFDCTGNYTLPFQNVSENESIVLDANVSDELEKEMNQTLLIKNLDEIVVGIIYDSGFKSDTQKIIFVVLFKIFVDIIFLVFRADWKIIFIINTLIIICFAMVGWIPFSIILLLVAISAIVFGLVLKQIST